MRFSPSVITALAAVFPAVMGVRGVFASNSEKEVDASSSSRSLRSGESLTGPFSNTFPISELPPKNPNEMDIQAEVADLNATFAALEDLFVRLEELDTSKYPMFDGLPHAAEVYHKKSAEIVSRIIGLVEKFDPKNTKDLYGDDSIPIAVRNYRRLKENGKTKYPQPQRRRAEYSSSNGRSTRNRSSSRLQEALLNGDQSFMDDLADHYKNRLGRHTGKHGRRTNDVVGKKKEQCLLLSTCVRQMSFYDLFIYTYSDDIDPGSGDLDTNIVRYQSQTNLSEKYKQIQELASQITTGEENGTCDNLLQHFFRVVEHGGIPEWHGGVVSQVCLAEGSTQYVDLSQMLLTLVDVDLFFSRRQLFDQLFDEFVNEMMTCSKELFSSDQRVNNPNFQNDEFVFAPTITSTDYRFPLLVDTTSSGCDFQKLEDKYLGTADAVASLDQKSAEDCKAECCMQDWCTRFDYHQKNQQCFLHNTPVESPLYTVPESKYPYKHHSDWDHYILGGYCEWDRMDGKNLVGYNDFDSGTGFPAESVEQCLELCLQNEGCVSLDYRAHDNKCFLSNDVPNPSMLNEDVKYTGYFCNLKTKAGALRDEFGMLQDNDKAAFIFVELSTLKSDFDKCLENLDNPGTAITGDMIRGCVDGLTKPLQTGMQYVFGAKTSPGYICGVNEAVKGGSPLPGTCCLDAPYQLDSEDWGFEYECSMGCQSPGPFFGGLKKEACAARGGNFCPVTNCKVLQDCFQKELEDATNSTDMAAYAAYLQQAPAILDPTSTDECYAAREYFGFEGDYINDKQICDDVRQLRYSRNFDFIAEFLGQGGHYGPGLPVDLGNGLSIIKPDASKSADFYGAGTWDKINNIFLQVIQGVRSLKEGFAFFQCLSDPFSIADNVCAGLLNGITPILIQIEQIMVKIHQLSVLLRNQIAALSSGDFAQVWEATNVIFQNMAGTGRFMSNKIQTMQNYIENNMTADKGSGMYTDMSKAGGDLNGRQLGWAVSNDATTNSTLAQMKEQFQETIEYLKMEQEEMRAEQERETRELKWMLMSILLLLLVLLVKMLLN